MTDSEARRRIIERIRAMQARTVSNGCTEAEAIQAAQMISSLLYEYRLAMADIEIQSEPIEEMRIDTRRHRRRHPIELTCSAIAEFTGCELYFSAKQGTRAVVFFGLVSDAEVAKYIYDVCFRANETDTRTFRDSGSKTPRSATHDFAMGHARGMASKLRTMAAERAATTPLTASGTALIPLRNALVAEKFAPTAATLTKGRPYALRRSPAAAAGYDQGQSVAINPGIAGDRRGRLK